jgi:hypothetical protein
MIIAFCIVLVLFITAMQIGKQATGTTTGGSVFGCMFLAIPLLLIAVLLVVGIATMLMPLLFTIAPILLFLGAIGFVTIKIACRRHA